MVATEVVGSSACEVYIMCMGEISEKNIITGHSAKCFSFSFSFLSFALSTLAIFVSSDLLQRMKKREKRGTKKQKDCRKFGFFYSQTAGWTAEQKGRFIRRRSFMEFYMRCVLGIFFFFF